MDVRGQVPRWLAIPWWGLLLGLFGLNLLCTLLSTRTDPWNRGAALAWAFAGWGLLQTGWLRYAYPKSKAVYVYGISAVLTVLYEPGLGTAPARTPWTALQIGVMVAWVAARIAAPLVFRREFTQFFVETENTDPGLVWWACVAVPEYYFQAFFHEMAEMQRSCHTVEEYLEELRRSPPEPQI